MASGSCFQLTAAANRRLGGCPPRSELAGYAISLAHLGWRPLVRRAWPRTDLPALAAVFFHFLVRIQTILNHGVVPRRGPHLLNKINCLVRRGAQKIPA